MPRLLKRRPMDRRSLDHLLRRKAKRRAFRQLFAETLEQRIPLTTVTSVDPPANSHGAPISTNVAATFDQNVNATTVTPQTFVVHSPMRPVAVTVTATDATVTADPTSDLSPGDVVRVTATSGIQSTGDDPVIPRVWEFRTAVRTGTGVFIDSGQSMGTHRSFGASLGDLDGDGDLDAFTANWTNESNRVWLNNGYGSLNDSGQSLGAHVSSDVSLGDLDGDGDLDAFVVNGFGQALRVWLNNGSGTFNDSGQTLANQGGVVHVSLGDLDGDGDLDAFVANTLGAGGRVWLNNGSGAFTDTGQSLGNHNSQGIALGDLDGDGDLDAFMANYRQNRIWVNSGSGVFSDSGQSLGDHSSNDVALGDLDGDGDLDAFVINAAPQSNQVWLNNADGNFSDSGQSLGTIGGSGISLGDLDGDGDLDAYVAHSGYQGDRVWLNSGGVLRDSEQSLGNFQSTNVALGDLDGDGDLDAFVPNDGQGNRVWLNQNPATSVALSVNSPTLPEDAGAATFTATLSAAASQAVTVNLGFGGTATLAEDYLISSSQIVIPAGATAGSVTVTAVQDTLDEANETVVVEITSVAGAQGSGQVTTTIVDDDNPPTLSLSVDNQAIPEEAGIAIFTATLSSASGQDVIADIEFMGTATITNDYTVSRTQIVIPAGSTSGLITVTAVQDALDEPDETIIVDMTTITGAAEDGNQQQATTITDDDDPPTVRLTVDHGTIPEDGGVATFTATLSAPAVAAVTVDLADSGTATESTDYILSGTQILVPAGATSESITVTSVADLLITEGPETVIVDIAAVSANAAEDGTQQATTTILDDVNGPDVTLSVDTATIAENGGVATFTATLASVFNLPVTVNLSFGGTAAAIDYAASSAQVVIPAGATSGSVTITAVDDALIEGDETVVVEIGLVINGNAAGTQLQTTTITDDEAPPIVTLTVDHATIPEAGGTARFTATLSAASTLDVTVALGFAGTATVVDDYTRSGTQIVVPAGATTGAITVAAVAELLDDGDETVIVDIIGVTNGSAAANQQQATTILDDDEAPPLPPGPTPASGTHNASVNTKVSFNFEQTLVAATVTDQTFVVHGSMSHGQLVEAATTVSAAGPIAQHDPANNWSAGELVQATVTSGVATTAGTAAPRVWQFRTASTGSGQFVDGGLILGAGASHVALGDADGDGDLDAVFSGSELWLNDGAGGFANSGQDLGASLGEDGLEFADVDGDGDLDLIGGSRVMVNDGAGVFSNSGLNLGGGAATAGDLDGDGDLDIMTSVRYGPNRVWLNNGSGQFTDSGQALGGGASSDGIVFGDLDNDGDLDAFEIVNGAANRVWVNDGSGGFLNSGQALGGFRATKDVDIGDIDADGDLDVITGNSYNNVQGRVYLNDGSGIFTETGQVISNSNFVYRVRLVDLEGDGDLDFVAFNRNGSLQTWLNDGTGVFSDTGERLPFGGSWGADVGDLDGDGDVDFVEASTGTGGHRVWIHQNLTPNVTLRVDEATIAEAAGTATITASLSAAHTDPVTVDLGISGTATAIDDYTISGTQIVIPVGSTAGSVTVTAVQDTLDEADETVIVDVINVTNGQGSGQVTTTILDDDEPPVPDVILSVDNATIPEDTGVATFSVTLSEATTVPVTVDLEITGTATLNVDYTISSTRIVVAAGVSSASVTLTAVQDTFEEPNETVVVDIANVSGGNESGNQQQVTTITDDDGPTTPRVSSLTGTSTGFVAAFSSELDTSTLNLYDTQATGLGDADATLVGASSGPVSGSLVVHADARTVTFVKTGDPLVADTYTVTLRSADNGFKTAAGTLLDGDSDGTPGGNFTDTFTVSAAAANTVIVGLPDFVRGPNQAVNVPADAATGIPIRISESANVRSAALQINYDPTMLEITAATVGAAMPAGATVVLDTSSAGTAILTFTSSADLPAGTHVLVNLQANIPTVDAVAIYGRQQVLDVHSVAITDGNANPIPVVVDDALHLATYFSDVSGNGRTNASDAAQVARFAAFLETGFAGSLLTDPVVMGDISGNGRINAADASLVAQFAAMIPVSQIPPIPVAVVATGGGGFPSLLLIASQEPQETRDNFEHASTLITSENTLPDYYPAVDTVMTALAELPGREAGEEGPAALERAVDELFSALGLLSNG